MGDPFKKVKAGERLRIPAAAFNSFIDAAQDLRRRQSGTPSSGSGGGSGSESGGGGAGVVLVKNCSGAARKRFDVLGIDLPVILPGDNEQEFKNRVAVDGVEPVDPDHRGKFVILLEPLRADGIGRACAAGVCPAWVKLPSDFTDPPAGTPLLAEVTNGDPSILTVLKPVVPGLPVIPGLAGSAQVLWLDPGIAAGDSGWALVRLGSPSPVPASLFPVKVRKTGGSAGTVTTACTFTYEVKDLAGTVLGTAMTPQKRRASVSPYVAPADGTYGLGFYDGATFKLWDANEVEDVGC